MKMAMVGVNGAGKSTFIKLLLRFYDPTEGRILIGGHDLRDVKLESWYEHIGALFQDYPNYRFKVNEAIASSTPDIPYASKVIDSAQRSGSSDFIEANWEHKYEQQLGREFTDGVEPSGGQWQKLALARAFYRDANVLILDEPTAAVDAEAEAKIFERLEQLPKNKTVFLISHRFSTVRHADEIVIIENGQITEQGSHEALLKKRSTYARLFKIQAKGYK